MAKAIMIQGTGSNVGKSIIVAGLCRAFARRGLTVRPFKPQNMSNNAAVTPAGGEIGRAQALQALAARCDPHTDMNPVLLKPQSSTGAQVIVQGKVAGHQDAKHYLTRKPALLPPVLESFARLTKQADLIVIEGAGSPAETNLRDGDIANMGFALAADVPVILMGDIDRGGVIAQIVGTQNVLSAADRNQIEGFCVNKFRGDLRLFDDGRDDICNRTGWPSLGVIPWFEQAHRLPAEDVMDITSSGTGSCKIAVPQLPRIANFDDLDPLSAEPNVTVQIVPPGTALPGDAQLILIPGSKATIADLAFFRAQGWDVDLAGHIRRGGHVLGICGGYQMLGRSISDPLGIEGPAQTVPGLGYLDIDTEISAVKQLALRTGHATTSLLPVEGYEIHMGQTKGPDCDNAWLMIEGAPHGAANDTGQIRGCYLHGLFAADAFRAGYLGDLGVQASGAYAKTVDQTLDALADHLETYMALDLILETARAPKTPLAIL